MGVYRLTIHLIYRDRELKPEPVQWTELVTLKIPTSFSSLDLTKTSQSKRTKHHWVSLVYETRSPLLSVQLAWTRVRRRVSTSGLGPRV